MPSNIQLIQHTYELPYGVMTMFQVATDAEAIYYAAGRQSYLYRSMVIDASYLFVPVMPERE